MSLSPKIADLAGHFEIPLPIQDGERFHGGHINDTYRITSGPEGNPSSFLLQRLNRTVFPEPDPVMENAEQVILHMRETLISRGVTDLSRRVITLIPARTGKHEHRDEEGSCWRMMLLVESVFVSTTVGSENHAHQAGRAFGSFLDLLADFPSEKLFEVLPRFHDTKLRYQALEEAIANAPRDRGQLAGSTIDFALSQQEGCGLLLDLLASGDLPQRVVHNDAKMSNVLLDRETEEALCVVDLDTVMPGTALFDFGDMIRSMTCTAPEDETNLERVEVDEGLFQALSRGYLERAGNVLTPAEKDHLVDAGRIITLEQGVRFLTDYLQGDRYYRTTREHHNLERSQAQFQLVRSILDKETAMRDILARI